MLPTKDYRAEQRWQRCGTENLYPLGRLVLKPPGAHAAPAPPRLRLRGLRSSCPAVQAQGADPGAHTPEDRLEPPAACPGSHREEVASPGEAPTLPSPNLRLQRPRPVPVS